MHKISGLVYIKDYIPSNDIYLLTEYISKLPFTSELSRRTLHYGYKYLYNNPRLQPSDPIPSRLMELISIEKLPLLANIKPFNQVIINEYKINQQISPHIDHIKLFDETICIISLGQQVDMKFEYNSNIIKVPLEIGSLVILTGDARYKWKHSLINKGKNIRYSITYRICK